MIKVNDDVGRYFQTKKGLQDEEIHYLLCSLIWLLGMVTGRVQVG
jgi:hypothetical protein